MRFQEARPKALDMARAEKEAQSAKKRKLDETDIEDGESVRQTRSRQKRSKGRSNGSDNDPIEVPDSEDGGDDDFLPDGMVKCPMCNAPMKEVEVYNHLDTCSGQSASQGRSTRSRFVNA
jgi:E3 ubiquitin-protein ligase RAD18